jgi:two-component system sensor histidine kinase YesM
MALPSIEQPYPLASGGELTYNPGISRRPWIFTRGSLVSRFFLVFLLAVAAPLVVVGIALTLGYRQFTLDLAVSRAAQALAPIAQGIDEEARRAALLTATLSTDGNFVESVVSLNDSRTQRAQYEVGARIDDRLSAFFNYTNKIGAVLLYLRDRPVFLHRNNGFLFDRALPEDEWFTAVVGAPDATLIMPDLDSYSLDRGPRPLLKIAVCPSRDALDRGFLAMVVAFRVPFLDEVAQSPAAGTEELLLVDSSRRVLLSGTPGLRGTTIDASLLTPSVFRRGGSTYVSTPASVASAGWTLISITDFSLLTRDVARLGQFALWLLLALVAGFAVYIEVFFRQVIHPVQTVTREMGRVEQGQWDVQAPTGGPAELARLGRSFNTMIAEVRRLTIERERQERERARLELEALRLQINPHFLTNTLNSIKMMAAISNAEPIRRMTAALMRVVSSSFRGGDSLAPIGEELDILEQYILIMRVRYADTFDLRIDVPDDLRGLRILRMLLQPLVENAIIHGLHGLERRGEITIRASHAPGGARDAIVLEVRDNGSGAAPEVFAAALAEPSGHHRGMTSIGLANVHRRIVLNHGDGFGLELASTPGSGTVALLRLPVIREA